MNDWPQRIHLHEEGPREGFQIEPGPIATADKIRFIEALAATGLPAVQAVSFVNPKRVPGMADAEEVASGIRRRPGVRYTATWLNLRGLERALATPLDVQGALQISASERFSQSNTGKDTAQTLNEQRRVIAFCQARGLPIQSAIVMTAFGCNIEGPTAPARVLERVGQLLDLLAEVGLTLPTLRLADTVGWASTGLANALMGLSMGVTRFDSSCAGLGGCPFAGHQGAAGNICTEDLVFMCEEMGIATGVDLDALIDCAHMAEALVGHPLPGKVMRGGSLRRFKTAH